MDAAQRQAKMERSGGNYGAGTKEMQVGGWECCCQALTEAV